MSAHTAIGESGWAYTNLWRDVRACVYNGAFVASVHNTLDLDTAQGYFWLLFRGRGHGGGKLAE